MQAALARSLAAVVLLALAATSTAQVEFIELPVNNNLTALCFDSVHSSYSYCAARVLTGDTDEPSKLYVQMSSTGEFMHCTADCRKAMCNSEACLSVFDNTTDAGISMIKALACSDDWGVCPGGSSTEQQTGQYVEEVPFNTTDHADHNINDAASTDSSSTPPNSTSVAVLSNSTDHADHHANATNVTDVRPVWFPLNSWLRSEASDPELMEWCLHEVSPQCGLTISSSQEDAGVAEWYTTGSGNDYSHCTDVCLESICYMECMESILYNDEGPNFYRHWAVLCPSSSNAFTYLAECVELNDFPDPPAPIGAPASYTVPTNFSFQATDPSPSAYECLLMAAEGCGFVQALNKPTSTGTAAQPSLNVSVDASTGEFYHCNTECSYALCEACHSVFHDSNNTVSLGMVVEELFKACPEDSATELMLIANRSCTVLDLQLVDNEHGHEGNGAIEYMDFESLNYWLGSDENVNPGNMQACLREVSGSCGLAPLADDLDEWAWGTALVGGPGDEFLHCSERCLRHLCDMKCNEMLQEESVRSSFFKSFFDMCPLEVALGQIDQLCFRNVTNTTQPIPPTPPNQFWNHTVRVPGNDTKVAACMESLGMSCGLRMYSAFAGEFRVTNATDESGDLLRCGSECANGICSQFVTEEQHPCIEAFPDATDVTMRLFSAMYREITGGCPSDGNMEEYLVTCLPGYDGAEVEDHDEETLRGNETDADSDNGINQPGGSQGRATAAGDDVISVRGSATWSDLTIDQAQDNAFDEGVRQAAASASNRPIEDVHLLSKNPGSVVATFVVLFPSTSNSEADQFATLVRDNPSAVASANPDLEVYGPVDSKGVAFVSAPQSYEAALEVIEEDTFVWDGNDLLSDEEDSGSHMRPARVAAFGVLGLVVATALVT